MPSRSNTPDVIVYGTVCLDQFVKVDELGNAQSQPVEMPGGEAFNTATALAGWGVNVLLTGTALGDEPEAIRLRHLLDTHPLGVSRATIPEVSCAVTPVCTVRVAPNGDRFMSGKGFAHAVAPPSLPETVFATRPIFCVDPNLGQAATVEALRAASLGCQVVAMDFPVDSPVVAKSTIAVTSEDTLKKQGVKTSPPLVARQMHQNGAKHAVVTQGKQGCWTWQWGGKYKHPAFAVPSVVDTTGAGDVFRAGLCYGLLHDWDFTKVVSFASAAAALHCQVWGGGSRPTLGAVQALLAEQQRGQ